MIRLALAQMRRSLPRLVSAGVAVLIGTAFVAATLVAGEVITRTTYDAVSASLADADLVVIRPGLSESDVAALADAPGVDAVHAQSTWWNEVRSQSRTAFPQFTTAATDPRLEPQTLVAGERPDASGEVALPSPLAERLEVGVGDEVALVRNLWDEKDGARQETVPLLVVGVTEDPGGAFAQTEGAAQVTAEDLAQWVADENGGDVTVEYQTVVVALETGADVEGARAALAAAAPGASVQTARERAEQLTAEFTGDTQALTAIVLGFAAVALVVAALVVTNTFQVLVAQRTRTLALLRCVGADRSQIRRSVLVEAGLLGLTASAVGVVTGFLLAQVTLVLLGRSYPDVPLPSAIPVGVAAVVVPLAVGTVVTLVAALAPARAATRVAPLAALRPADAPTGRLAGRGRAVLAGLLTIGGAALLALGVAVGSQGGGSVMVALPVGVLGGALSFVGVVVGAVLWIPRVVSAAGRLLGSTGPSARIAAANTGRNPRRTAATSAALLIGVTLVAMMSTGAASARATLNGELDTRYPVDAIVADPGVAVDLEGMDPAITRDVVDRLRGVEGVAAVTRVQLVPVEWADDAGDLGWQDLRIVTPEAAAETLHDAAQAAGLADGTVVVGQSTADAYGIRTGDELTVRVDGPGRPAVSLRAEVTQLAEGLLATPATLAAMDVELPSNELWLRLADDADVVATMDGVQDVLSDSPLQVLGAALERAAFEDVVDTMLAIVVGLLAAAVVIAVIGVANTLSLSVIERRRESATLRAIGMSRGQLRRSLAVEGTLIAGVGSVLGMGLGLLYGWAGTLTTLSSMGSVALAVPWRDLGLVLAAAVVAGLLASVLPARSAARTSPVAALAVE